MMDELRHTQIQAVLNQHGIGAWLGWRPDEIVLTTGYYPQWGVSVCLYPRWGNPILFNPALEPDDRLPAGLDVRHYGWGVSADPWGELVAALQTALRERGLQDEPITFRKVASQSTPCVNSAEEPPLPTNLAQLLEGVSSGGWVEADSALLGLYLTKTPQEVERIRLAHQVAAVGIQAFYEHLTPGTSEAAVAAAVESAIQQQMATRPEVQYARGWAFVQGGANAIYGGTYSRTTGRRLEAGDLVMIELGVCVNGYWADITRTGVTSGAALSPAHQAMFDAVKTAQAAAVQAVGPGVPAKQVDRAARNWISDRGYGRYFLHHTGHHVGFRYHDPGAIINPTSDLILQPGMIVTIEPGVYGAELGSGCRIEDNVLVTETGFEILSDFPRELTV
ncbi:MAG: aminopeptidase P family protein [Chloroflexi bacterium]|nr:aminopeptidase P family protein [Chloroflexota bacterium]